MVIQRRQSFFIQLATGLSFVSGAAQAQQAATEAPVAAQQVTVTGQMLSSPLDVGGFGDTPISRLPFAASVLGESRLRDAAAKSASDLARLDAGVSAAYDAEGYITSISARGFQLDNRANYRRDGLAVNGETVIHLGNKRSLELLKGTSGMLAGTSAPGGLVNLVVKRPTARLRSATIDVNEYGGAGAAVDLSERFGADDAIGIRINAGYERLRPALRDAKGSKSLAALAGEWRGASTLVEAEVEQSRQSQPSQPGFSLLGNAVPDADTIDPRINLNNQPWSLPVVLSGRTASLRVTQALAPQWKLTAHAMTQRLVNDDRVAFPYGVYDPATFSCDPCDRYASDGTFTLWEFQSDGEKRRAQALDIAVDGRVQAAGMTHRLTAGVLRSHQRASFGPQIFDIAGTGRIDAGVIVPRSSGFTDVQTNRDERSTEFYARDAIELTQAWRLWAGLRHTRLDRASVRTDASRPTRYEQAITTPWIALGFEPARGTMAYASFGQGIETDVAPNRARYTNAGQPLPALRSRQAEAGIKLDGDAFDMSAAIFDIDRPIAADIGLCDSADASCTRRIDGSARHRGAEALISWQHGPWQLHASAMLLDAKRRRSSDAAINGLRPVNVPKQTARAHAAYDVGALPSFSGGTFTGLTLMASLVHEGERIALPDNTASVPAWTRLDVGARWRQTLSAGQVLTWRVGIDNATNERAWKEAPYQFGHAYLYPLAPRTVRMSLQAAL